MRRIFSKSTPGYYARGVFQTTPSFRWCCFELIRESGRMRNRLCCHLPLKAARWHSSDAFTNDGTPPPLPPSNGGESDFVDLQLDDLTNALGSASARREVGDSSELGVVRENDIPEGQVFSRLNIPISSHQEEQRTNSRSALRVSASDTLEETIQQPTSTGSKQPLPYDDERFADMLLEMEVEGSLDETWQDGRKAYIEDVKEILEVLRSLKVRDICAIDVSNKTSNFDYMLFGTCEGPRHIHLAAWAVQEADALKRVCKIRRKQVDHTWEVVPVGRIIVNLMQESLREELSLERKWAVTKCMDPLSVANAPVSEGRSVKAHGLWTLTLNLQDLEDFEVDYCKDVLLTQV
uniref:MALSU1 n=1 Tax=Trypanosoma brucei brucei TaxID=5702 RepID=UPI00178D0759|nr:Chain EI, MALSU1 [Trypanosoma brucei brucei]